MNTLLNRITTLRHNIHVTSGFSVFYGEAPKYFSELDELKTLLLETGTDVSAIVALIPNIEDFPGEEDIELGLVDGCSDDYRDESINYISQLNDSISDAVENWLRKYDATHGTEYAPTGIARMRWIASV